MKLLNLDIKFDWLYGLNNLSKMLTEIQLDNLKDLCENPKYGKILQDAIKIWRQKNVKPCMQQFGLDFLSGELFKLVKIKSENSDYHCCIIGGAMVDKKHPHTQGGFFELVGSNYNITEDEVLDITFGFDDKEFSELGRSTPAYEFGKAVSKIIFSE